MKGKEIELGIVEETVEDKAKKVILSIRSTIKDRREELQEAENKLAEVLDKDISDITEKDGNHWDW